MTRVCKMCGKPDPVRMNITDWAVGGDVWGCFACGSLWLERPEAVTHLPPGARSQETRPAAFVGVIHGEKLRRAMSRFLVLCAEPGCLMPHGHLEGGMPHYAEDESGITRWPVTTRDGPAALAAAAQAIFEARAPHEDPRSCVDCLGTGPDRLSAVLHMEGCEAKRNPDNVRYRVVLREVLSGTTRWPGFVLRADEYRIAYRFLGEKPNWHGSGNMALADLWKWCAEYKQCNHGQVGEAVADLVIGWRKR